MRELSMRNSLSGKRNAKRHKCEHTVDVSDDSLKRPGWRKVGRAFGSNSEESAGVPDELGSASEEDEEEDGETSSPDMDGIDEFPDQDSSRKLKQTGSLKKKKKNVLSEMDDDITWSILQLQAKELAGEKRSNHRLLLKHVSRANDAIMEVFSGAESKKVSVQIQDLEPQTSKSLKDYKMTFMFHCPVVVKVPSHSNFVMWTNKRTHDYLMYPQTKSFTNEATELVMEIPSLSIPHTLTQAEDPIGLYFSFRRAYLMETKKVLMESSLVIKNVKLLPTNEDEPKQILDLSIVVGNQLVRVHLVFVLPCSTFEIPKKLPKNQEKSSSVYRALMNWMALYEDQITSPNDNLYSNILKENQTNMLVDAINLLKIWLDARRLLATSDSLPACAWMALIAQLAKEGTINPQARSLNIFKAILNILSGDRLCNMTVLTTATSAAHLNHKDWEVTMLAPDGVLNLARHCSASWVCELQARAIASVEVLENTKNAEQDFMLLFPSSPQVLCEEFDHCFHVSCARNDDVPLRSLIKDVEALLKRALTDRCKLIRVFAGGDGAGFCSESSQDPSSRMCNIIVAITTNQEAAWRKLDRGPTAEDKVACKSFRNLWGTMSEIRRFHDSSICESVFWECPQSQIHNLIDRILDYILVNHLAKPCKVLGLESRADSALISAENDLWDSNSKSIKASVLELETCLKSVEGLALPITLVTPVGSIVRQTNPFPPKPYPRQKGEDAQVKAFMDPIDVLVQLETKGGWPMDPLAYRKTKAALGAQLALELENTIPIVQATEEYIDLVTMNYAYRLHLFSKKDEFQAEDGHMPFAPMAFKTHGYLMAATSMHSTFAVAARLAKRWVGSQMLSNHFSSDIVELLMLHVYSRKGHQNSPGSPLAGFTRFLSFLIEHPFHLQPVFVDPRGEFSGDDFRSISRWYTENQKSGGITKLGLCLCTPFDRYSSITQIRPNASIVRRLVAVASAGFRTIQLLTNDSSLAKKKWRSLFSVQVDFHLLIFLDNVAVQNPEQTIAQPNVQRARGHWHRQIMKTSSNVNLDLDTRGRKTLNIQNGGPCLIGFRPVALFVEMLEQRFRKLAHFCYDEFGGHTIGVRWIPETFLPRPLDPTSCTAHVPLGQKSELLVIPDIQTIMQEIWEMGNGLVVDIQVL